ncbi:exodeoxyribonuclease I [Parendozoicomonas haliclonae]|uniref:Exodeoxyribonuclease I n=1 Tax=Parendozoicomonas haliclonae TaxID=1960125 RepID=A0A1X7AHW3_9GAMM|nr:exodeoxyribonuclease I [Parendozoicomonas haliclonae]SMA42462.1 Exodeoxyribonuclease I [Parendozoicomonas haliclonae]
MAQSFYFYDYETWGTDPARDWPAQFAGIRTNANFEEIDEPLNLFCRLPAGQLPHPEACLVTGLTPDDVNSKGICEAEFIRQINEQFSRPNTCVLGYNSIRFDDEVTRYSLYRNFNDPYAREWQNGCSRWDLIDVVRLCAALRPDGINWPKREDGTNSFRLEELTAANGITHAQAHDAVSDVRATIALARLLREKQPKLFQYALDHRLKNKAGELLDTISSQPKAVLHISGMFPASRHCLAVVVPLAAHPTNKNEVIVYDLAESPEELLRLSAEDIKERLYTTRLELEEKGLTRVALKTVRLNRCPILLPKSLIKSPEEQERLGVDMSLCEQNYRMIFGDGQLLANLRRKLMTVFSGGERAFDSDPDCQLYGGFFSNDDKRLIDTVRTTRVDQLASLSLPFRDGRLEEMLFRYRARNWPESLTDEERGDWQIFCRERVLKGSGGQSRLLPDYLNHLNVLIAQEENAHKRQVLADLKRFVEGQLQQLEVS